MLSFITLKGREICRGYYKERDLSVYFASSIWPWFEQSHIFHDFMGIWLTSHYRVMHRSGYNLKAKFQLYKGQWKETMNQMNEKLIDFDMILNILIVSSIGLYAISREKLLKVCKSALKFQDNNNFAFKNRKTFQLYSD